MTIRHRPADDFPRRLRPHERLAWAAVYLVVYAAVALAIVVLAAVVMKALGLWN